MGEHFDMLPTTHVFYRFPLFQAGFVFLLVQNMVPPRRLEFFGAGFGDLRLRLADLALPSDLRARTASDDAGTVADRCTRDESDRLEVKIEESLDLWMGLLMNYPFSGLGRWGNVWRHTCGGNSYNSSVVCGRPSPGRRPCRQGIPAERPSCRCCGRWDGYAATACARRGASGGTGP